MNVIAPKRFWLCALLVVAALVLVPGRSVPAQEPEQVWEDPTNLSGSGYTSDPVIVRASNGVLHAVWKDDFRGSVYSRRVDGVWTSPTPINFPWASGFDPEVGEGLITVFDPQLVADEAGFVHAFWTAATGTLRYSVALSDQFGQGGLEFTVELANDVIGFHAAVDSDGFVHVAYVSVEDTAEQPAGVYIRSRNPFSGAWSNPRQLYISSYLRGLEGTDIFLQLLVVEEGLDDRGIYVVWDNRPRRQFFLASSTDNGVTWSEPHVVVGPDATLDSNIPYGVGVQASNNQLILIWREAEVNIPVNCTQYYRVYGLDGNPISSPESMYKEFSTCPVGKQHMLTGGGNIVLLSNVLGQPYLLAWNGEEWSIPQEQDLLGNFNDPGTFQLINLRCLHPIMAPEDQLLLVGCDTGPGGDIWFTSRSLAEADAWFSRSADWSESVTVTSIGGLINPIVTAPDDDGVLHAVWAQSGGVSAVNKNIYYASWDGVNWNYNLNILQPPFGSVNHLSIALDEEADQLYLVWSGGEQGELYFSGANSDLAGSPSEWSAPAQLPMPRPIGTGADIKVTSTGELLVVYSVAVNEQRGVYLTRSDDGGSTWSTPNLILDGTGNGWEVIGSPTLAILPDGSLQLLVLRLPPPEGGVSPRLYYTRSVDGALTWQTPEEIASGDLSAMSIGSLLGRTLYRYWQESSNGVVTNFIQTSGDSGLTWTDPQNFIGMDSLNPTSSLVQDVAGQLHLIQVAEGARDQLLMQEWLWTGTKWESVTLIEVASGGLSDRSAISANIRTGGNLGVLFSKLVGEEASGAAELVYAERQLEVTAPDLPPIVATPPAPPTPTPVPPTPTPQLATPTVSPDGAGSPAGDSIVLELLFGFVSATIVVIVAFALINRFARRTR